MADGRTPRPRWLERVRAGYERLAYPSVEGLPPPGPARPFRPGVVFTTGINLPWLVYGGDFGRNAWWPDGGVGRPDAARDAREHLARLADAGHQVVRWFTLCDGRSGITTDEAGRPTGIDAIAVRDLETALELLDRVRLSGVFVLLDFLLGAAPRRVRGVQVGGRRAWIAATDQRRSLIERVLVPFAAAASRHPALAAWDVFNEPEWMTRGRSLGPTSGGRAVGRDAMAAFLAEATAALHATGPSPITVGLASMRGIDLVQRAGLDLFQVHWYDRHGPGAPLDTNVAHWELGRPVLLGEYPTANSARSPADIVDTARRAGYCGALAWSALARDHASATPSA